MPTLTPTLTPTPTTSLITIFRPHSTKSRVLCLLASAFLLLQFLTWVGAIPPSWPLDFRTPITACWWQALIPIVTSLISMYAGNKASKNANKRTSVEKTLEQLLLDQTMQTGQFGSDFLGRASGPLTGATQFWQSVLNGDRQSLMGLYGKEVADMGVRSRETANTQAQLMPRGGASAEFLSRLPYQRAVEENRLFSGGKPLAADKLSELGTNFASLGLSGLTQGKSGGLGLLGYGQDRREYAGDQGARTGEAVYNLINSIYGASQAGKKPSGGTASDWWTKYPAGNDKGAPWYGE